MHSVSGIGVSMLNAILGVFYAILVLGQTLFASAVQFGQSVLKLGMDLFQGVFGLVAANFFVLLILGGGYYWYTQNQKRQGGIGGKTKRR